jgi:4-hydroxymandelate oxidase
VWVDGGIRRGLDVLTALALGADGVLVGRPFYWALAAGGRAGVVRATDILRNEIELAMALLGVGTLADISRELLAS